MSLLGLNIQLQKLEVVEEWLRGVVTFKTHRSAHAVLRTVRFSARGRCILSGPVFTVDKVREGKQREPHHGNSHTPCCLEQHLGSSGVNEQILSSIVGRTMAGGRGDAEGGVLSFPPPRPSDRGLRAATVIVPERNLPELSAIFPHESFFISFTLKFKPFLSFKSLLCCLTSLPWFSPPSVLLLL